MDDDLLRFSYSMGAYNGVVATCGEAQEKVQAQGQFDDFLQRVGERVPDYDRQSLQENFAIGQSSVAMLERVPPAFRAQACQSAMQQQRADEDFGRLPEKMDQLIDNHLQTTPEKATVDPRQESDRMVPVTSPTTPSSQAYPGLGAGNPKALVANLLKGQAAGYVNASGGYHEVVTFCDFKTGDELVAAANAVQSAFERVCGQSLGDAFAKGQASMAGHREQARRDHERACRNGSEHARCAMTSEEFYCHVKEQDLFTPASRLRIHLDRRESLVEAITNRCQ